MIKLRERGGEERETWSALGQPDLGMTRIEAQEEMMKVLGGSFLERRKILSVAFLSCCFKRAPSQKQSCVHGNSHTQVATWRAKGIQARGAQGGAGQPLAFRQHFLCFGPCAGGSRCRDKEAFSGNWLSKRETGGGKTNPGGAWALVSFQSSSGD